MAESENLPVHEAPARTPPQENEVAKWALVLSGLAFLAAILKGSCAGGITLILSFIALYRFLFRRDSWNNHGYGVAASTLSLLSIVIALVRPTVLNSVEPVLRVGAPAGETRGPVAYESARGHFRATFPCRPTEKSEQVAQGSVRLETHAVTCVMPTGTFMASGFQRAQGDELSAAERAKLILDGAVNGMGARVTNERDLVLGGLDGREVSAVASEGGVDVRVRVRVVVSADRAWMVFGIEPTANASGETERFINSFVPGASPN